MQGCHSQLGGLYNPDESPALGSYFHLPPPPPPPRSQPNVSNAPPHVTGKPSTEYLSDETAMTAYANLHLVFEQMRIRARCAERGAEPDLTEDADTLGHEPPRVLVIGPEHSGKTTACKILANYAVRGMAACAPLYINLDPSEVSYTTMATVCRFYSTTCAFSALRGLV